MTDKVIVLNGEKGDKGVKGDKGILPKDIKIAFILITILFFVTVCGFSWALVQNSDRVSDIQASRISSCKSTYRGIKLVFTPFFPPKPRTVSQQADVDKFDNTLKHLESHCTKQTKP